MGKFSMKSKKVVIEQRPRYQHPLDGMTYEPFYWCDQCETAHPTAAWAANDWSCPNPANCEGDEYDSIGWQEVRTMSSQFAYPETPEAGHVYSMWVPDTCEGDEELVSLLPVPE